jgi:hypothetical protein
MPIRLVEDVKECITRKQKTRSFSNDLQDEDAKHPRLSHDDDGMADLQDPALEPPVCTEGYLRFTTVSDGSKDCMALLVTRSFVDRVTDISEQNQGLSEMKKHIDLLETDAEYLELSTVRLQRSVGVAKGQEASEELNTAFKKETLKLDKVTEQLRKLKSAYHLVERRVEQSRQDTHHVLAKVMEAANLSRPTQPAPTFDMLKHNNGDDGIQSPPWSDSSPSVYDYEPRGTPEEMIRHAARMKLDECARFYYRGQAQFDDQKRHYEQNLAWYKQGVDEGAFTHSRSEFDRRAVVYGQELTGALIDAEAAFENAREEARALHATDSTAGLSYYGSHCETSFSPPVEHLASYNTMHDWSFVKGWRSNVAAGERSGQAADVDEWDARTVEISDSLSAIDNERYARQIVRWQAHCSELEVPSETRWAVDRETLTRRRSL